MLWSAEKRKRMPSILIKPPVWPLKKGSSVWISNLWTQSPLPAGLADRTPVVFLGSAPEDATRALLQGEDGRVFRVGHNQYGAPSLYMLLSFGHSRTHAGISGGSRRPSRNSRTFSRLCQSSHSSIPAII